MKTTRRNFLQTALAAIGGALLSARGIGRVETEEQYVLWFARTRYENRTHLVQEVYPEKGTCLIRPIDEWWCEWTHMHNGIPILKAHMRQGMDRPTILHCANYVNQAVARDVRAKAFQRIHQRLGLLSWTKEQERFRCLVPMSAIEKAFDLSKLETA